MTKKFVVKAYGRKLMRWRIHGSSQMKTDWSTGVLYKGVFATKPNAMLKVSQLKRDTDNKRITVEMIDDKDRVSFTGGRINPNGGYYTSMPYEGAYYSHHENIYDWERAEKED
jgi:hypothetical protein